MSYLLTKAYLDTKYPNSLYLTKKEVDIETGGMACYVTKEEDGKYLISSVARYLNGGEYKRPKAEILAEYNERLERNFKELGMTREEAAKKLEIKSSSIAKYLTRGKIIGDRNGGIDDKSVEEYLRNKQVKEKKTYEVPLHPQTANIGALELPNHYEPNPTDSNQEEEPHCVFGWERPTLDNDEKEALLKPVEYEKTQYVTLEKAIELSLS